MTLSESVDSRTFTTVDSKPSENSSSFCGDAESLLDKMIEQCQTKSTTRHPGFGRKLVPYFSEDEADTSKAKGEYSPGRGRGGGGYRKPSPRSRGSRAVGRPFNVERRTRVRNLGGASLTLMSKKDESEEVEYLFESTSVCSLFAGPICFNSPPPEALPMPTAVLLAKAMCLS